MKCQSCLYSTSLPKEQQKCTKTVECSTEYCYTTKFTRKNQPQQPSVKLGCVKAPAFCSFPETTCRNLMMVDKLTSCDFECCKGDMCNSHGDNP